MDPHKREHLSHAGQKQHVSRFMRLILHFLYKTFIVGELLQVIKQKVLALFLFHLRSLFRDFLIVADRQEHFVQVSFHQMAVQRLIHNQLLREMPHDHLILCVIAEDTDIDLIAESFAFQELRLLYF